MNKVIQLNVEHAGLMRRAVAYILDSIFCFVIVANLTSMTIRPGLSACLGFFFYVLYYFSENAWCNGQTLGKKILGIRCICIDQMPLKWQYSLLRGVVVALTLTFPLQILPTGKSVVLIYSFIVTLLGIAFSIYPIFHPQNRSFLDIVTRILVIRNQSSTTKQTVVQGPKRIANIVSLSLFCLTALASGLVVSKFSNWDLQVKRIKTLEKDMSQFYHHQVSVQKTFRKDKNLNTNVVLLSASVQIPAEEFISYQKDESLRNKALIDYYTKLMEFNDDPSITHLQISFGSIRRRMIIFPIRYNLPGKIVPIESVPPHTLAGRIKACDQYANAAACTDASYTFSQEEHDYTKAMQYALKGCTLKDSLGCYNVACYYCRLTQPKEALQYFQQSIELYLNDPEKQDGPHNVENDSDLDCIRKNKDFQKTLKAYREKNPQQKKI